MTVTSPGAGIRFALLSMLAFAVQDATSKYLAAGYPPQFFIMVRYWLFAGFVVMVAARRAGGIRAAARTRMPVLQIFRGVLMAVQIIVIVSSFRLVGLGATHAVFALHPLLTTLLAVPVLGERIGWRRAVAILVGFAGVIVILRPGTDVFRPEAVLALAAALMMGIYSVSTRLASRADGSATPAFFWLGVGGVIPLTLVGPFYWTSMAPFDWGVLVVHAVVGIFGHWALIRALELCEAAHIQPLTYLPSALAVVTGWAIFGETVDLPMLLGMALVIGAGLYAIWREHRLARARTLAIAEASWQSPRP